MAADSSAVELLMICLLLQVVSRAFNDISFRGVKQLTITICNYPLVCWHRLLLISAVSVSQISLHRTQWDWWYRNCIPLKLITYRKLKQEQVKIPYTYKVIPKHYIKTKQNKSLLHCESSLTDIEGGYLLSKCQYKLDASARKILCTLCRNGKNPTVQS